jgi:hypothetical protein
VTRRQGRPYTLVLKKTDALFAGEQEARTRDKRIWNGSRSSGIPAPDRGPRTASAVGRPLVGRSTAPLLPPVHVAARR